MTNENDLQLLNTQIQKIFNNTSIPSDVVETLKAIINEAHNINHAMTGLYKVTDEADARYNKFLNSTCNNAQKLGRSVSNLIQQTATWSELGYSIDESEKLAQISSIYANIGKVSDTTAVSNMAAAMEAFNIEASDAITIVDALNTLDNKYATSASDLGTGLSASASSMAAAGTDINKTLAMLTGGAEITQSAEEFGNMLKVSSMRIRGMKDEFESLGEEVDNNIESVSKIQTQILELTHGEVNIFDNNNECRDYYDIMEDIASVYDSLSSDKQASLSEILFGKHNRNQGTALIQAFQSGQIQQAYEDIQNSAGSAYKEQERWLSSLDAKTQQFNAAFQSLANTLSDSGLLQFFVDLGTTGINATDGLSNLLTPLGAFSTAVGGMLGANDLG